MRRILPILIVLAAAWHFYAPPARVAELEIIPDSVEYAVAAQRFAATGRYEIVVNGRSLPPRYPPGFSVVFLAPVYAIAPDNIGNGIVVVWLAGIACVLLAYLMANQLAGPWGGVLAAVALARHPQFAAYTQVIMTDIPAVAFALAAAWVYTRWPVITTPSLAPGASNRRPHPGRDLLTGLLIAAAASMRPLMIVGLLPFLIDRLRNADRRWRGLFLLGIPSAIVLAANEIYQSHAFGDWRRTGYQFWLSVPYDIPNLVFSRRYVRDNLALFTLEYLWMPLVLGAIGWIALAARRGESSRSARFNTASMRAGPHSPTSPEISRNERAAAFYRLSFFFVCGVAPLSLAHLFYFFTDLRFHFLAIAMACIFAGAGVAALIPLALQRRMHWMLLPVALLMVLPGPPPHVLEEGAAARDTIATTADKWLPTDATLISAVDPVYLEQRIVHGGRRRILPLDRHTPYASAILTWRRIAHLDPPPRNAADHACPGLLHGGAERLYAQSADESLATLQRQIRDGVPVFIETLSSEASIPARQAIDAQFFLDPIDPQMPWLARLRSR